MKDPQGAYIELTVIKIRFKNELDACKFQARRTFRKITHYLLQGNGEFAEAYHEEVKTIRRKAIELQKRIVEIQEMQENLRRTA